MGSLCLRRKYQKKGLPHTEVSLFTLLTLGKSLCNLENSYLCKKDYVRLFFNQKKKEMNKENFVLIIWVIALPSCCL